MVSFNVPLFCGTEFNYIHEAIDNRQFCGDGPFTENVVSDWNLVFAHKRLTDH